MKTLYFNRCVINSVSSPKSAFECLKRRCVLLCLVNNAGIAVVTVESLGRRPLLLVGVAGMIVSLFVLGISSSLAATSQGFAIAAVLALLAYVSCYQVGS